MNLLWLNTIIFSPTYLIASVFLFLRSSHPCIISRSPTIIQICHWANLSEIIFTSMILSEILPRASASLYWAVNCMMSLSHYLMVFCYLIRGYRLYYIFKRDPYNESSSSSFYGNVNKISQRWMILTLLAMMSPIIILFVVIQFIIIFYEDIGLYTYGKRTTIHFMIDNFIEFLLELSLITIMYYLRLVENEFQMFKEMLLVTVILCIAPVFSLFVHDSSVLWMYAYILRNVLIMLITTVSPIVSSYIHKETIQMLSTDSLYSLHLVLQHPTTLNAFEKFLKNCEGGEGCVLLELYLSCELFFDNLDPSIARGIVKKVKGLEYDIPVFNPDRLLIFDVAALMPLYNYCFEVLENNYFYEFKDGKEFGELKMLMHKQEVLNNRISKTSLQRGASGPRDTRMTKIIRLFGKERELV